MSILGIIIINSERNNNSSERERVLLIANTRRRTVLKLLFFLHLFIVSIQACDLFNAPCHTQTHWTTFYSFSFRTNKEEQHSLIKNTRISFSFLICFDTNAHWLHVVLQFRASRLSLIPHVDANFAYLCLKRELFFCFKFSATNNTLVYFCFDFFFLEIFVIVLLCNFLFIIFCVVSLLLPE